MYPHTIGVVPPSMLVRSPFEKLKDRITPHVNNVQRKPLVENISETEARTIKNESLKGASGRWIWMDDVGKGGGGGGGGDVPLIAVLFLSALSLRCSGSIRTKIERYSGAKLCTEQRSMRLS